MKLVNQIDNILSSTFISALSLSYLIDSPPLVFLILNWLFVMFFIARLLVFVILLIRKYKVEDLRTLDQWSLLLRTVALSLMLIVVLVYKV